MEIPPNIRGCLDTDRMEPHLRVRHNAIDWRDEEFLHPAGTVIRLQVYKLTDVFLIHRFGE